MKEEANILEGRLVKLRSALIASAIYLTSSFSVYAQSTFPEVNVTASPEKVCAWFQGLLSQHGGILRSSSPSVYVFETTSQRTGYWEGIRANMNSPTGKGTGQYITRLTVNALPGIREGVTHVILIEERIMNYGSSFARPLTYKAGGSEYLLGVQLLQKMKADLEADSPVSNSKPGLVNWRAGERPSQP